MHMLPKRVKILFLYVHGFWAGHSPGWKHNQTCTDSHTTILQQEVLVMQHKLVIACYRQFAKTRQKSLTTHRIYSLFCPSILARIVTGDSQRCAHLDVQVLSFACLPALGLDNPAGQKLELVVHTKLVHQPVTIYHRKERV